VTTSRIYCESSIQSFIQIYSFSLYALYRVIFPDSLDTFYSKILDPPLITNPNKFKC